MQRPRKSKHFLLGTTAVLFSGLIWQAKADEPRGQFSLASADGRYEFRMISRTRGTRSYSETWSLVDKGSGEEKYSLSGEFADKTVVVSSDGRSLAVLDDFCFGEPDPSRVVVTFYRDSKLARQYSLAELSIPLDLVMSSASHFSWYGDSFSNATPRLVNNQLSLRTLSRFPP
jgi:hypothetical protein